jgi:hypothetical protein
MDRARKRADLVRGVQKHHLDDPFTGTPGHRRAADGFDPHP